MRRVVLFGWLPPRHRRLAAWAVGLFAFYLIFGFLILPPIVRAIAVKQLTKLLHREVSIRQIRINPLVLSTTVRGLIIETNHQPFMAWDEFYANFQVSSVFRWRWTFDELRLTAPRMQIVLDENGRLNFADLLAPNTNAPAKPTSKSGLSRLLVFHLIVTNGHVGFVDRSRRTPFSTVYEPINLRLTRLTTQPDQHSPYSFEARGDAGSRVSWGGSLTAQPLGSRGTLRLVGLQLPRYGPYLEPFTRAQITNGTFNLESAYRCELGTNGLDLVVSNLAATVSGLKLRDPATGETALSLPSTELRGGFLDSRTRQARVGSITVNDASTLIRRRADESINLLALLVPGPPLASPATNAVTTPSPAKVPPWMFTLDEFGLKGASVEFEDATLPNPFRTTLKPVELSVAHFTTATSSNATLQARVATELAETLDLSADFSANPISIAGRLKVNRLELKKYQPYVAPLFGGQLAAGKLDVGLDFVSHDKADSAAISNGVVRLTGLQIQSSDNKETLLDLPDLAIENASADLASKTVRVGAIKSGWAAIHARREADGNLNWQHLLATKAPVAQTAAPASASPAAASDWKAVLDELALREYTVLFEDRQRPQPAGIGFDHLALTIRGTHFPSNAPAQFDFSTRVNAAGTVTTRGSVRPYSPAGDLELEIAGLDLSKFQSWIVPPLNLGLNRGALNSKSHIKLRPPDAAGPRVEFEGDLAVTNLVITDPIFLKDLIRCDELAVKGTKAELAPNRASIQQVVLNGLRTSIVIGPKKQLNLLAVLPAAAPGSNATPATAAGSASSPFSASLSELMLQNASIHFEDQSIQPPCLFDLQRFGGAVKGLSTKPDSTANLEFTGTVDEGSPFGLHGTVHPQPGALSLNLAFTNSSLQLTPFTPYVEKYVGHALNKGRLSLNLDYSIQTNALKAQNKVRIDQLLLGPRNDSPDAPKLPVKLAVALLKDNSGRIDLDLPVEGRLGDPQFRLGPVIVKVLVNLIIKAAASPFKLLGALVGGGEELSYVDFAPGQVQLTQTETNKLNKLVAALEKRPALSLEIEGSINPVADRDALARGLVQEQVKLARLKELAGVGQQLPSPTYQAESVEFERILRARLTQTFGTNLVEAVRALAARTSATNLVAAPRPRTRDPGLFRRVFSIFRPRKERAATLQAHRNAKADALLLKQNPELATLTAEEMERLLAMRTEVPPNSLRQLMQERAKAVQTYLLSSGKVTADRLFLVAPKTPGASFQGDTRVNLSLE